MTHGGGRTEVYEVAADVPEAARSFSCSEPVGGARQSQNAAVLGSVFSCSSWTPAATSKLQVFIMGGTAMAVAAIFDTVYLLLASRVGTAHSCRRIRLMTWTSGGVLMGGRLWPAAVREELGLVDRPGIGEELAPDGRPGRGRPMTNQFRSVRFCFNSRLIAPSALLTCSLGQSR